MTKEPQTTEIPESLRQLNDEQLVHWLITTDTWLCREAAKRLTAKGQEIRLRIERRSA